MRAYARFSPRRISYATMSTIPLLGDTLIKHHGDTKEIEEIPVSSMQGSGKVIGILFSARWCPPCRIFVPKLTVWYEAFKKTPNGEKFEIVFISSDKDEATFKEHFSEMPWLALPFRKRTEKAALSMNLKVSGIPTLVLINGDTGHLITHDGRTIILEDKDGSDFPWVKRIFSDLIPGEFINKEKEVVSWENVKEDVIGIYFSASWCGPCRAFTPQLARTYNKVRGDKKSFQIIFVSSDRDDESLQAYLHGMPWLAIPFGDSRMKNLSRFFHISGIPALIIMKRNGEVINMQGRNSIALDPDGLDYPWTPTPVKCLNSATAAEVNDNPSLIWFTDNNPQPIKEILVPLAEKHNQDLKNSVTEKKLIFLYHCEDDDEEAVGKSLKDFVNLKATLPLLVLLDISNQSVFISKEANITEGVVKKIVNDFVAGKLGMSTFKNN